MKADLKQFGLRVRELRLAAGMSQEELADRAGLHRTYIGGIERGERNIGLLNVFRLATTFGISVADLFPSKPHSAAVSHSATRKGSK
ncbi:MAG: XRE family transcriptional regulator [Planctomycetota bacterium]|nr:MAG: XRE family transcriptional regulator [Planctomycetota bacterium]